MSCRPPVKVYCLHVLTAVFVIPSISINRYLRYIHFFSFLRSCPYRCCFSAAAVIPWSLFSFLTSLSRASREKQMLFAFLCIPLFHVVQIQHRTCRKRTGNVHYWSVSLPNHSQGRLRLLRYSLLGFRSGEQSLLRYKESISCIW